MTPEAAIEALKALHVHGQTWFADKPGAMVECHDTCRACRFTWPCPTRRILDLAKYGEECA